MKTIYTFRLMLTPLLLAAGILFSDTLFAADLPLKPQQETTQTNKGDDDTKSSKARAEKVNKPQKRKRVKPMKTNHGPRKPIFPQLHRKQESLNRAQHRDPYFHHRH